MITQREKVSIDIREGLTRRLAEFSIILDDVSITDMQFSREYVQSVEAKQVAQQVAEMKKFKVQKEQELAKANAIRSQGSAESARLVNEAIEKAGRGMITLRKIQAAEHIAETLQRSSNVTFLSGNTVNMLNLSGGSGI